MNIFVPFALWPIYMNATSNEICVTFASSFLLLLWANLHVDQAPAWRPSSWMGHDVECGWFQISQQLEFASIPHLRTIRRIGTSRFSFGQMIPILIPE